MAEVKEALVGDGSMERPNWCDIQPHSPPLTSCATSYAVEVQQLKAWFWETYSLSTPSENARNCTSRWLHHVLEVPTPQPALREALLAICLTQCGRVNGDLAMLMQGQQSYSKALRLLRIVLDDAERMQHNDTLAATGLMILYEAKLPSS